MNCTSNWEQVNSTQNSNWPGIPSGVYTAVRYTLQDTARFSAPFYRRPLAWTRTRGSLGSLTLPPALYDTSSARLPSNMTIQRWEPSCDTVAVGTTFAIVTTAVWKLSNGSNSYWWPCDTTSARVEVAAVGLPVAALSSPISDPREAVFRLEGALVRDSQRAHFTLARPSRVDVTLFDIFGRRLLLLGGASYSVGAHSLEIPIASLPSGLYFVSARWDGRSSTRRFVIAR